MAMKDNIFKPEGVYPAMVTPFDNKGNINESALRGLVDWLIKEGVDGLFPLGSSGEFIHLTFEEKIKVMEVVVDEARDRVPVLPSVTESNASKCIELAKKAKEVGCSGVVIAPPYYFPISQDMLQEHYIQIAQAIYDLPIILYNIPTFSTPISYDSVERLSTLENVVALKDSSGSMVDLLNFMDKVRLRGEDINILVGREEMLYSGLMVGAKGTMSATAGVIPELMVNIYTAWLKGEIERARKIQIAILSLIREMFSLPFPLGFKAALEVRGFEMGSIKQALSTTDRKNYHIVKDNLQRMLKTLLE